MKLIQGFSLSPLILFWMLLFAGGCIETIEPEFDYKQGLIFIDAFALSEKGLSQVSIKRSLQLGEFGSFENVENADVSFINEATGSTEILSEISPGFYVSNDDFTVEEGEVWKLSVIFDDGTIYESTPQQIREIVELESLNATFMQELKFDPGFNDFVPGHKITATFTDPASSRNFYIWRMRSFEPENVCLTCFNGIYRNGDCVLTEIPRFLPNYYDYICLQDCWRVRYGSTIPIFSDQLVDGSKIEDREVADVILYRRENILVEIQQMSVDESTYRYYKTINDLIAESGGLNAPTPAALLGNISNRSNSKEIVIGNFTAASVSTKQIYLERELINGAVDPDPFIHVESCIGCPRAFPCEEGENRTSIKPVGWPE